MGPFYHLALLSNADRMLIHLIGDTLKINMRGEVSRELLEFAYIYEII